MKKIVKLIVLLTFTVTNLFCQTITVNQSGFSTNNILGGGNSVNIGTNSGASMIQTTSESVFVGFYSGHKTLGLGNTYVGAKSGFGTSIEGFNNTFIGRNSGYTNHKGFENSFIGAYSGKNNYGGYRNTFIGFSSGSNIKNGIGNIFIGTDSGPFGDVNEELYIDNIASKNPLIWGDFRNDLLKLNGKVGIGGSNENGFGDFPNQAGTVNVSNYNLFVKGGILTEEVRVLLKSDWADYVFEKDYDLKSLDFVENFINDNGHLPNVPSASSIKESGLDVAEMLKIQQEKIEELTLYIIQLKKEIDSIKDKK